MMRLHELSQMVGGNLTAQSEITITGAASIAKASATEVTFACAEKHWIEFLASDACAAIVPAGMDFVSNESAKPYIEVENVEAAFVKVVEHFKPPIERTSIGIHPQAIVSPTAQLAGNVTVHAGAVVMDGVKIGAGSVVFPNATVMENCSIGCNVRIFPGATIYENTVIGDRSIIHSGAVLGAFGFGYKSNSGVHTLSAQLGNVVIGDDVEIGANSTIDRGTYDSTTIGAGSKLDNLVMVGHNCVIGEHNLLCSQVGIAGSSETGDYVVMGGQVGLADHLKIGNHVAISAKSGLMQDVADNQKVFGFPARPAREAMRIMAYSGKLPEMHKSLKQLKKQVEKMASACNGKDADKNKAA